MGKRAEKNIDTWIEKMKKEKGSGFEFLASDYAKEIGVTATFLGRYFSWNTKKVKNTGVTTTRGTVWEILVIATLLLCGSTQAFIIQDVVISPEYNVLSGDQIIVSFTVIPEPYEAYTSNPNTVIQIVTSLQDPDITRQTNINGYITTQNIKSNTLNLEGWDLAYKSGGISREMVNITIKGKAPQFQSTGQVTVFDIAEYSNGIIISTSRQAFQKLIISPNDLQSGIFLSQKDLDLLKKNIDEKKKIGVDTSIITAIYNNSVNSITLIKSYPPTQYPLALERLQETNAQIKRAQDLLDKGWAKFELDKTTTPLIYLDSNISQLNQAITNNTGITRYLTSNKSQLELKKILENRSQAFKLVSIAITSLNSNQYAASRNQSQKAKVIIDSALSDAIALQKRNSDPLNIIYENWLIVATAGIIIVLVLLFKPKRRRKKKVKKMDVEK